MLRRLTPEIIMEGGFSREQAEEIIVVYPYYDPATRINGDLYMYSLKYIETHNLEIEEEA